MVRKPLALVAAVALLGGVGAVFPLAALPAAAADTDVRINEVHTRGTNDNPDAIELVNIGSETVDLSGWVVKDDNDGRTDTLASGTLLGPGEYLVLREDIHFTFGLGNGDATRIYDAAGTLIDSFVFPVHSNPSWSRCPNGTGDFVQAPTLTLGAANDCAIAPADSSNLVLNEVDSGPADWVEFFNTGDQPLDISGYIMTDNSPEDPTHRFVFPVGTIIEPRSYFVIQGSEFGVGLGGADSVHVFVPGTVDFDPENAIQSVSWTSHASIDGDESIAANSRCPNVTGEEWEVAFVTPGSFNDCATAIRINEVESNGDATDWVEIVNASGTSVDISGWTVMDNDPVGHAGQVTPLPTGTVLEPGKYFVFEENTHFTFGLGREDVASVRNADGVVIAEYSWTDHAEVTYGRCPDTTGMMGDQTSSTKGAKNICDGSDPEPTEPEEPLTTIPWPGSPDVTVIDETQMFLEDSSGLDFQETADGETILWAIDNGTGTLFQLDANADGSVEFVEGWEAGKRIQFPKDAGNPNAAGPDAEGVTVAGDGFVYVASERDNNDKGVNDNTILKVDPNATGETIVASQLWDLTESLPTVAANTGVEAIEWVSDSVLAGSLWDDTANAPYSPANYSGNGGGLFFIALENNGHVYAYALYQDGSFDLVTEISPQLGGVMALDYDTELGVLWAVCDNGCEGTSTQIGFNGTATPDLVHVDRPAGMPNLNNEGFATATDALCIDGERPVWWFADGEVPGSLRSGTLPCGDSDEPTDDPTDDPTDGPTDDPTDEPTDDPTDDPTDEPSTDKPGALPDTGAMVLPLLGFAGLVIAAGGTVLAVRRRMA